MKLIVSNAPNVGIFRSRSACACLSVGMTSAVLVWEYPKSLLDRICSRFRFAKPGPNWFAEPVLFAWKFPLADGDTLRKHAFAMMCLLLQNFELNNPLSVVNGETSFPDLGKSLLRLAESVIADVKKNNYPDVSDHDIIALEAMASQMKKVSESEWIYFPRQRTTLGDFIKGEWLRDK